MRRQRVGLRADLAKVGLATIFVLLWGTMAHAQTFGGRACGALVGSTRFCDTGPLPPAGGDLTASESSIVSGVLSTGPANSHCHGGAGTTQSTASVQAIVVTRLLVQILSCGAASAQAIASCGGMTGSSTITELVFAGVTVEVTGKANQVVSVPGVGTLTINEQVTDSTSIRVNALHLVLATGEQLILCGCESSVLCGLPVEESTWGSIKDLYR